MSREMKRDAEVGQAAPLSERAPVAAQMRIDAFFDGEDDVLALESHPPLASSSHGGECDGDDEPCPYSHGAREETPARAA